MTWTPPTTGKGKPCTRCKPTKACIAHRKEGRRTKPSKLTPQLLTVIQDIYRKNGFHTNVAKAIGVHSDTLERWLRDGQKDADADKESLQRSFFTLVSGVRQDLKHEMVNLLLLKARGDYYVEKVGRDDEVKVFKAVPDTYAITWYLERAHKEEYGKSETLKHEGAVPTTPVVVERYQPSAEEIAELERLRTAGERAAEGEGAEGS